MKKIGFGQTVGILANCGVLAGILLLAYELNQNRQMMEAQTRTALAQGIIDILTSHSSDEATSTLIRRGDADDNLSADEQVRYRRFVIAQFRYHENVHYQYRIGLYDEAEYLAHRATWQNVVFSQPGIVDIFCSTRGNLSPAFVAEIEGLLTTYTCD